MQKSATILNTKYLIMMEFTRMMESVPTFELSHQFLVWVAQEVIAVSDLDLLLPEYYKERLNPK